MATILIGCKLPHGITLKGSKGQPVLLNGLNTSRILGGFGITHVDASEWAFLKMSYPDFAPIVSGAIFESKTDKVQDIAAIGDELSGQKTGLEGLDPEAPGAQLKPEDKQKMPDPNEQVPARVMKPSSNADAAAARELAALS